MTIHLRRTRLWFAVLLTVAIASLFDVRPQALSTGVVISQVYGGGGNAGAPFTNDFIELFNRGTSSIDLTGWSVQYASATGTGNFSATPLTGSIAPGQYLLVQQAAGATIIAPLPAPDATGTIAMSATAGKVILANTATGLPCNGGSTPCLPAQTAQIVDLVGYGNANFFEGTAAPTLANATAALRKLGGCTETDNNANDFASGTPTPRNRTSTASSCGLADTAPTVSLTSPVNGSTTVPAGADLTVTFSEPVTVTGTWFTLTCSVSGALTATAVVSGGPLSFTINPAADLIGGESCTLTVVAANVRDADVSDPPDLMPANVVVAFTVFDACTASFTRTYAIQGSGPIAAITGAVTTRGVVIGDYEGPSPTMRGFFIQDATGDGNAATSDGIFVFNNNANSVSLGDVVVVTGTASEFQDQTQVTATSVTKCGTGTVTPVDVILPVPNATWLERFEGMLVMLPQTLSVTEHFQLARFGQVVVSSGGRLPQPTDVTSPGPLANALQAQNDLNRLIIDDAVNDQNPDPILFGRGGAPLSAVNTLRGGDTATGTVGVMTFTWAGNAASGNAYRVRPVNALNGFVMFAPANPRPASAPAVAGSLRIASMNVLNFFNTFGVNACTGGVGGAAMDCRGADNAVEFARQWPKTVAAILKTRADVVGLVEIENDGYGPSSALRFLVDRLNAATAPGTYALIDVDAGTGQVNAMGTDAIKVALIYKPARVIAVGQAAALNTLAFVNGGDGFPRTRPALAQAFEELATGGRLVVTVNHFKSKGSECDAPDAGDGQGNCNAVRVKAALELSAWLAGDPTGIGDPDVLVLGDLNAYNQEDPVVTMVQAGYTRLVPAFGGGFSYVFDGQWGSLDHALASTTLRPQVVGAHEWTINADEPPALDYNTDFKSAGQLISLYAADEFRVADHNPLVVDLMLTVAADETAHVSAGAHLLLINSAGLGAGDAGSTANLTLNAKFKKGSPSGELTVTVRRAESDGVHTYQVTATAVTSLISGPASDQATVVATARIEDITNPKALVLVDAHALVRVTITDNGEPGRDDTVAITVLTHSGALWFSSRWDGVKTVDQTIAGGNIQVR